MPFARGNSLGCSRQFPSAVRAAEPNLLWRNIKVIYRAGGYGNVRMEGAGGRVRHDREAAPKAGTNTGS